MKTTAPVPLYLTRADAFEWIVAKFPKFYVPCAYFVEAGAQYGINWALLLCHAIIRSGGKQPDHGYDLFSSGNAYDSFRDAIMDEASVFSFWDEDVNALPDGAEILAKYEDLKKFGYARSEGKTPNPPEPKPTPPEPKPTPPEPKPEPKPEPLPPKQPQPEIPTQPEPKKPQPEPSKDQNDGVGWKQRLKWIGSASGIALTAWTALAFFAPIPSPIVEAVKLLLKALSSIFS